MTSARIHLTAISIGVGWHFPHGDHKEQSKYAGGSTVHLSGSLVKTLRTQSVHSIQEEQGLPLSLVASVFLNV